MFSWLTKRSTDKTEKTAPAPAPPAPTATPDAPATAAAAPAPAADAATPPSHDLNLDALLAPPTPPAGSDAPPVVGPADPAQTEALSPRIVEAISTVFDPEIPVNIYELGLIYEIIVDTNRNVAVRMTLTSPACPSAQQLPSEVRYKVKAVEGVADCNVDVVWEPAWTKDMMSEAAKLSLGIF